jgi:solute:Na+ symporter, SSS family
VHRFTLVDTLVVVAYFLVLMAIGIAASRANRSARDYFAGGNRIPWWVSGMTMYMANFSAWTFSGAAGFAYETGWFAVLYFAVWPPAYLVGTLLTAAKWRRTRSVSPVEFTRTRFSPVTQQLLSWVIGTNFLLTAGVQLAAVCTLLAPVAGIDIRILVVVTGAVILVYTFFGGIWAVSVTDVVQGIILLGITMLMLPLAVGLAGGFPRVLGAVPPLALEHTYNGVHYDIHWLVAIFLIMTVGVAAGQAQRFYSVRDERAARRTGFFAAALFLTVPLIFGIPPLAARAIWPDLAAVPFFANAPTGNPRDLVFLALCLEALPAGLVGFFVAAMLAATMSTLSSVFNMVASIVAKDVYQGALRPAADDRAVLRVGRAASVGVGAVVTALAIVFIEHPGGIFNAMQALYTLLNVPIVVPIAAGLLVRRASPHAAIASVLAGLAAGMFGRWVLALDFGPQFYLQFCVTLGVFLATMHPRIAALLGRVTDEQRARLAAFFARLDTPVDVPSEVGKEEGVYAPIVMAGWVTLLFAALLAALYLFVPGPAGKPVVAALAGFMAVAGIALRILARPR